MELRNGPRDTVAVLDFGNATQGRCEWNWWTLLMQSLRLYLAQDIVLAEALSLIAIQMNSSMIVLVLFENSFFPNLACDGHWNYRQQELRRQSRICEISSNCVPNIRRIPEFAVNLTIDCLNAEFNPHQHKSQKHQVSRDNRVEFQGFLQAV